MTLGRSKWEEGYDERELEIIGEVSSLGYPAAFALNGRQ